MTSHHDAFASDCPHCMVERSQNLRSCELLQDALDENARLRKDARCLSSQAANAIALTAIIGVAVGICIGTLGVGI